MFLQMTPANMSSKASCLCSIGGGTGTNIGIRQPGAGVLPVLVSVPAAESEKLAAPAMKPGGPSLPQLVPQASSQPRKADI